MGSMLVSLCSQSCQVPRSPERGNVKLCMHLATLARLAVAAMTGQIHSTVSNTTIALLQQLQRLLLLRSCAF